MKRYVFIASTVATLLVVTGLLNETPPVCANEPRLEGNWQGDAGIARGQPDLSQRNWTLSIHDGSYLETHETVVEGGYSIDVDKTPAEINMSFGAVLRRDEGIYDVENDKMTLNYRGDRPSNFGDTSGSFLRVLKRSADPEWSTLARGDRPISGSWTTVSLAFDGRPIDIWKSETFVFGTDKFVVRHTSEEKGIVAVDLSVSPGTVVFKPEGEPERKRYFWFKGDYLFISNSKGAPHNHVAVYRHSQ